NLTVIAVRIRAPRQISDNNSAGVRAMHFKLSCAPNSYCGATGENLTFAGPARCKTGVWICPFACLQK
ncbi:hypothetical protein, partial [Brucella ceti]|uniref:hypothetical protein n=1 Tax=Brucella ceti TaxID=120577 RepID=UPI001AEBED03